MDVGVVCLLEVTQVGMLTKGGPDSGGESTEETSMEVKAGRNIDAEDTWGAHSWMRCRGTVPSIASCRSMSLWKAACGASTVLDNVYGG